MFAPIDEDDPVIEIAEDQGGVYAVAPLSFCSENKHIAAVQARLTPMLTEASTRNPSVTEFSYSVLVFHLEDLVKSFATQDRRVVASALPRNCVTPIIRTVMRSATILVKKAAPARIYRVAITSDMPDRALRKHLQMNKHLINLGYEIAEPQKDPSGRLFWLAEKSTSKGLSEKSTVAQSLAEYNSSCVGIEAKHIPLASARDHLSMLKIAIGKQIGRSGRARAA